MVNTRDRTLAVSKQHELAAGIDGPSFEFDGDHMAVVGQGRRYAANLVEAITAVSGDRAAAALPRSERPRPC